MSQFTVLLGNTVEVRHKNVFLFKWLFHYVGPVVFTLKTQCSISVQSHFVLMERKCPHSVSSDITAMSTAALRNVAVTNNKNKAHLSYFEYVH